MADKSRLAMFELRNRNFVSEEEIGAPIEVCPMSPTSHRMVFSFDHHHPEHSPANFLV